MKKRILAALLAVSLLSGCSASNVEPEITVDETTSQTELATEAVAIEVTEPASEIVTEKPSEPISSDFTLSPIQQNSINMLNYLALTAEQIGTSKENSVILEDIYNSLLNDINPGTVDEITQEHLNSLRTTITDCLNVQTKRQRLQYIYNQDKANAVRNAVPDPLTVLSITNSCDWKSLVISVAFTAIDSYNNYHNSCDQVDRDYLLSGWELDDEQLEIIRSKRSSAFNYRVDIIREYSEDIDKTEFGKITLSEDDIQEFVKICAIEEPHRKLQRLLDTEKTYRQFGNYWITLADCYYELDYYVECLYCVEQYQQLHINIYNQDFILLPILPKAIVAAQNVYEGEEYITEITSLVSALVDNSADNDWAARYFAAQVYLDLYSKSQNDTYLQNAYGLAKSNVAILVEEQEKLNDTYHAEIDVKKLTEDLEKEIKKPDTFGLSKAESKKANSEYKKQQNEAKKYAKLKANERETELPPLYEPLLLNCDLLFALANQMGISETEKASIQGILKSQERGIFISIPVNNRYSFDDVPIDNTVEFSKKQIQTPANLLSQGATIIVTVTNEKGTHTFKDWEVTKVERNGSAIDTFIVYLSSETIKKMEWTEDCKVIVEIHNGDYDDYVIFNYEVAEYTNNFLFPDKIEFVKV